MSKSNKEVTNGRGVFMTRKQIVSNPKFRKALDKLAEAGLVSNAKGE